jgi:hypothetical protein
VIATLSPIIIDSPVFRVSTSIKCFLKLKTHWLCEKKIKIKWFMSFCYPFPELVANFILPLLINTI